MTSNSGGAPPSSNVSVSVSSSPSSMTQPLLR